MKEKYIKNSIVLFVCLVITKCIGAIYKIPLSNILGTLGIGIYQMVFFVYSLFLVFITGALPTYLAQKVSHFRANNKYSDISSLIKNAFLLAITLGLIFSLVLIFMSKTFSTWQGNENAYLGYIIVGTSVTFSATSCVIKGYFQGFEYMTPTAICGIIEQTVKLCFGLLFASIFAKNGVSYAVFGAFLGVLFSEFVAFVFMLIFFLARKKTIGARYNFVEVKNIFFGFLPLVFSNLIAPLSNFLDSFLVVNILMLKYSKTISTSLFGIATGMVAPVVSFPVLLCGTICTAVLPKISFCVAQKQDVSKLLEQIIFFIFFIFLPCAFGVFALSKNIILAFFPSIEFEFIKVSIFYLKIMSFVIIWQSLNQIFSTILIGISKYKLPLYSQTLGLFIKTSALLLLLFFTKLNILSLAISINIGNICTLFLTLFYVKKNVSICIQKKKTFLIFLSCLVMLFVIYFLDIYFTFNIYLKIIALVIIGMSVYFLLCFLFGILEIKKIKNIVLGEKN